MTEPVERPDAADKSAKARASQYVRCLREATRQPKAWLIAAPLGVAVGLFLGVGILLPLLDRPPVILLPSKVVSTRIPQGGYLEFMQRAVSRRGRSCPGSITREFHRQIERDGKPMWQKWRTPLSGAAIEVPDEGEWTVVIELLPGMEPGHWRMVGESTYHCWLVFGGTYRYRITPLEFDILPAAVTR